MAERRRGLGRGLGALIPPEPEETPRRRAAPTDVFFAERTVAPVRDDVAADRADEGDGGRVEVSRGARAPQDPAPVAPGGRTASSPPRGRGSSAPGPEDAAGAAPGTPESLSEVLRAPPDDRGSSSPSGTGNNAGPGTETTAPLVASSDVPRETPRRPRGSVYEDVPVDQIRPNPRQPRTEFDETAMAELVRSVREIGVLQPVILRPAKKRGSVGYELVMGERRWRAAVAAGLTSVPAIVRDTPDEALLRDALLENLHRSDLNPLEEAAAYQQLLEDFGCTHDELATRLGRSRPQVSNTLRLMRLPWAVQRRLAVGLLSAGHARAMVGLVDPDVVEQLAERVVSEGLSVRATEEAAAKAAGRGPATSPVRGVVAAPRSIDDLVGRLSDRLATKVSVSMGVRRSRLVVEFAGVEDLNRILASMAPDDPGVDGPAQT